jgi:hypothetical protein
MLEKGLSMTIARLFALALIIACGAASPNDSTYPNAAVDAVSRLEQQDARDFHDMHGNANDDLQQLMTLRFAATQTETDAIDRMAEDPSKDQLVEALYHALGFVKDPSSIDWLREKLQTGQATVVYDLYLPKWRSRDGFGTWEWLTGRERWIAFWLDTFDTENSPARRSILLDVLAGFDEPPVRQFFERRRTLTTDPKEILIVEAYLQAHDVPADGKRIEAAIHALSPSPSNFDFLVEMADQLRHEAFVPFLIEDADRPQQYVSPTRYPAQVALKGITFELSVSGRDAWRQWFARHGTQGREQWRQKVLDDFRDVLHEDPEAAKEQFEKSVYRWNDIALLSFIRSELVPRAAFQSEIAGWINLTYTPYYRQRLQPIADSISRDPGLLEDWARRLLQERGYLPGQRKKTWEETVHYANMNV